MFLRATLHTGRPWHESFVGRMAHDAFAASIPINEKWVAMHEDIIRKFDDADDSAMLAESAGTREDYRAQSQSVFDQARAALEAERYGLEIIEGTAL